MPEIACGAQRTTFGSWVFPFSLLGWVLSFVSEWLCASS